MPFGDYSDMSDCISKNQNKDNPGAYCASIHKKITGKWPAEKEQKGMGCDNYTDKPYGEEKMDYKNTLEKVHAKLMNKEDMTMGTAGGAVAVGLLGPKKKESFKEAWEHDGSTASGKSFAQGDVSIRISTSSDDNYNVIVINRKKNSQILNKGFDTLAPARQFMQSYMRSHSESFKEVTLTKDDVQAYVDVQMSGRTNMFDVTTVSALSGLPKDKIMAIMKDYGNLVKKFGISRSEQMVSVSPEDARELQKLYDQAVASGQKQFVWKGKDILTSYAKYLLQYLKTKGMEQATMPEVDEPKAHEMLQSGEISALKAAKLDTWSKRDLRDGNIDKDTYEDQIMAHEENVDGINDIVEALQGIRQTRDKALAKLSVQMFGEDFDNMRPSKKLQVEKHLRKLIRREQSMGDHIKHKELKENEDRLIDEDKMLKKFYDDEYSDPVAGAYQKKVEQIHKNMREHDQPKKHTGTVDKMKKQYNDLINKGESVKEAMRPSGPLETGDSDSFTYKGFGVEWKINMSGYVEWDAYNPKIGGISDPSGGELGRTASDVRSEIKSFIDAFIKGGYLPSGLRQDRGA